MDEVYVVTAGDYSEYHIEAMFRKKDKAEDYCSCHPNSEIEIFKFSDDKIYTPFNRVHIQCHYRFDDVFNEMHTYFNFERLTLEDWGDIYNKDCIESSVYEKSWFDITINRVLTENYNEEEIRDKYTKVFQDLKAEIKELLFEQPRDTYDDRKRAAENVLNAIKFKFGLDIE